MLLSAIVVNHRRPDLLRACLRSLETALERVEGESATELVDNGSGAEAARPDDPIAPAAGPAPTP